MDLRAIPATDGGSGRGPIWIVGIVFAAVAVLAAVDLAADLQEGTTVRHAVVEGALVAIGTAGVVWVVAKWLAARGQERGLRAGAAELAEQLARSRAEAERWRAENRALMAGLAAAIDRQFRSWGLSAAEAEVALLLLKGLSHKEVAAARKVSEATVRQQARGLYRKASVEGRHGLAAFFLEDLLAPPSQG